MVKIWRLESDNGKAGLEFIDEAISLDAGSEELPAGVYTTFRTYNHNNVLRLLEHFDRLVESARLQRIYVTIDQRTLRSGLQMVIATFPGVDVRVRIHWSMQLPAPMVYLMGEKFNPIPEEMYLNGVAVQIIYQSRENPLSKATSFIRETRELRTTKTSDVHEYLMVGNNGEILEGMTSNVFCILNEKLYTASSGILMGITRQLVLEAVGSLSVPVVNQGLSVSEIAKVDEVFITSASRGVLPVTVVDGNIIGSGKPGKLTQRIGGEFIKRLEKELTAI
ncbi:MAG: aminotransferase class IV [Leptolinea sp.]